MREKAKRKKDVQRGGRVRQVGTYPIESDNQKPSSSSQNHNTKGGSLETKRMCRIRK